MRIKQTRKVIFWAIACVLFCAIMALVWYANSHRSMSPQPTVVPTTSSVKEQQSPKVADKKSTIDEQRLRDINQIAEALDAYYEKYGVYPVSKVTCEWQFDADTSPTFLIELIQDNIVDNLPHDKEGLADTNCKTIYGAKHYMYYSNGTKYAVLANLTDTTASYNGRYNVQRLTDGDRVWFDATSKLLGSWGWSNHTVLITNPALDKVTTIKVQ